MFAFSFGGIENHRRYTCGIQYEIEEKLCGGGLFSMSTIHFKEIIGCDALERITVRCGNQYPRGNESRMTQPGW